MKETAVAETESTETGGQAALYDPNAHGGDEVIKHVGGVDRAEAERIGAADAAGKDRKGVREAVEKRLSDLDDADAAGNGPVESGVMRDPLADPKTGSWSVADSATVKVEHQASAPADLVKLVDASQERGFLASTEGTDKPDYSQRNPAVMGRAEETGTDDEG